MKTAVGIVELNSTVLHGTAECFLTKFKLCTEGPLLRLFSIAILNKFHFLGWGRGGICNVNCYIGDGSKDRLRIVLT